MPAKQARMTEAFAQAKRGRDAVKSTQAQKQTSGGIEDAVDLEIEADEKFLRQFDLASKYGPLSGITRLERWERAQKLGLNPSEQVKALVLKYGIDSPMNKHIFEQEN